MGFPSGSHSTVSIFGKIQGEKEVPQNKGTLETPRHHKHEKKNKKLGREYHIAMVPSKIYELMDTVMQEKVWIDLESESGPLESRSAVPFHTFMYDVMIMKFGLQSIAIKTLI
mgnify:CR=1 FL=1